MSGGPSVSGQTVNDQNHSVKLHSGRDSLLDLIKMMKFSLLVCLLAAAAPTCHACSYWNEAMVMARQAGACAVNAGSATWQTGMTTNNNGQVARHHDAINRNVRSREERNMKSHNRRSSRCHITPMARSRSATSARETGRGR